MAQCIAAFQAPLSMPFPWQEYWRLPFPSPGDLPNSGIKPMSSVLQADSLPTEPPGEPLVSFYSLLILSILICNLMLKKRQQHLVGKPTLKLSYHESVIPDFFWF